MHIAIAGYGDLTRYILPELIAAAHTPLILTRSLKPDLSYQKVVQHVTDYTIPSLTQALHDCDAVISTISDASPIYTTIHSNILAACTASPRCKRFIPAEFAANIKDYPDQPGFYYASHEPVREMLRAQEDVEWTLVCTGWLADYFVPARNRWIRDIGDYHPLNWAERSIVIPGTGWEPVDFTSARDVARGLVRLLGVERGEWEEYTFMSGERSCWNDAIEKVQKSERESDDVSREKRWCHVLVERISLHAVTKVIRNAKSEKELELAEYHLLSISQACGNPPDAVAAQKKKFFSGVRFRTLEEILSELRQCPDMML